MAHGTPDTGVTEFFHSAAVTSKQSRVVVDVGGEELKTRNDDHYGLYTMPSGAGLVIAGWSKFGASLLHMDSSSVLKRLLPYMVVTVIPSIYGLADADAELLTLLA